MEEKVTETKEHVIKEGEEGDCLYVVGSGTLLCQKVFKGNTDPTFLKTYQPGEAFGELSLLYNAPRAATIIANEECQLWKLDRETFNHIVKEAANKRRQRYEQFLTKVQILSTMEPYERSKLSDAFKELKFAAGDIIIREGDDGSDLYLVQDGEAVATKTLDPTKGPE
jgi:cAMP-dependent protein kinase regulator